VAEAADSRLEFFDHRRREDVEPDVADVTGAVGYPLRFELCVLRRKIAETRRQLAFQFLYRENGFAGPVFVVQVDDLHRRARTAAHRGQDAASHADIFDLRPFGAFRKGRDDLFNGSVADLFDQEAGTQPGLRRARIRLDARDHRRASEHTKVDADAAARRLIPVFGHERFGGNDVEMGLVKQPEHLLQQRIEFTIALDGGDPGSVSFMRFVPIDPPHRGIEMFLFHRPPDDLEGLLSDVAAIFGGGNVASDALFLRRLCLRYSPSTRQRAAEKKRRYQRE